jgi:hypothetical protein
MAGAGVTVDLDGAVADVVDTLQAAGIRAAADPRDLNPPAVYVAPPELTFRFAKLSYDATWTLAVVVPNTGRRQSLALLGPLVAAVVAVFPAITTARPVDLVGGLEAAGPLPAYELTMTTRIQ